MTIEQEIIKKRHEVHVGKNHGWWAAQIRCDGCSHWTTIAKSRSSKQISIAIAAYLGAITRPVEVNTAIVTWYDMPEHDVNDRIDDE